MRKHNSLFHRYKQYPQMAMVNFSTLDCYKTCPFLFFHAGLHTDSQVYTKPHILNHALVNVSQLLAGVFSFSFQVSFSEGPS